MYYILCQPKIRKKTQPTAMEFATLKYENSQQLERLKMEESTQILRTLGKRIATLRKQRGMNQEEFAEVSGKMINTISNIERGLSDPKVTTLLSIAQALNVSVDMLFSDEEQPQPVDELPDSIQTILNLIKNQDAKTLKTIQKQIEALLELINA